MMMKRESTGGGGGSNGCWGRICDTCRSAPCTVYCRIDSAFLCTGCDVRIHAANQMASQHERVWVCEACERAPAAFICKADAASLCTTCDADIHSANPLARRHHRVPVIPIPGCLYGPQSAGPRRTTVADPEEGYMVTEEETMDVEEDEDEAASWLLLNPVKNNNISINNNQNNNGFLFGGEVDEYLDLVEYNSSCTETQFIDQQTQYSVVSDHKSYGSGDSVVPVQCGETKEQMMMMQQLKQQNTFQIGMGYESSKPAAAAAAAAAYSSCYNPPSISHSTVSIASMDVGIVPESTMSDNSKSHPRPPKGTIDLFSSPPIQMPTTQLTPMDREARVLRYREKKKTRKFEKTIRYASRKAYAETRPRIKGRFAKRTDAEFEVDQIFSTSLMAENGYGIVPSF